MARLADGSCGRGVVDESQVGLIQLFVDRSQGSVEAFVVLWIGCIADTDDISFLGKEAATASSLNGKPGNFDVGRPEVLVVSRHLVAPHGRIVAVVAAYVHNRFADVDRVSAGSNAGRSNRAGNFDRQESDVPLIVEGQQASSYGLAFIRPEEVHFDPASFTIFAEDMPTGKNECASLS